MPRPPRSEAVAYAYSSCCVEPDRVKKVRGHHAVESKVVGLYAAYSVARNGPTSPNSYAPQGQSHNESMAIRDRCRTLSSAAKPRASIGVMCPASNTLSHRQPALLVRAQADSIKEARSGPMKPTV